MKIKIGRLELLFSIRIAPHYIDDCINEIKKVRILIAIKIYKDHTGKNLSESRDYIYKLRDKLNNI